MSGVWITASASVLLRRVVNVISTLSITHHYLPRSSPEVDIQEKTTRSWKSLCLKNALDWNWGVALNEQRVPGVVVASAPSIPWPWLRWPTSPLTFSSEPTPQASPPPGPQPTPTPNGKPDPPSPLNNNPAPPPNKGNEEEKLDTLHRLLRNPVLYDPVRAPRYPIVLCHGLYGFDVRGPSAFPSLRMQYWSTILGILRKTIGAEVIVTSVPGTGSIASRSEQLNRYLERKAPGRGLNFMAHSMGGLDCRHLITHVRPTEYTPLSLTTIATPHRGSPFMDWCTDYLGIGRTIPEEEKTFQAAKTALDSQDPSHASSSASSSSSSRSDPKSDPKQTGSASLLSLSSLPSSFTTLLLSMFDSPAYANLTTTYLNTVFNPATPDDPNVKYFSVAGRAESMNVWHPLWLPKLVLDGAEARDRERLRSQANTILSPSHSHSQGGPAPWDDDEMWGNDGLVTVQSARWGEFLGTMEGSDHWELRGASGIEVDVDLRESLGLGMSVKGWNNLDWSRFVRAWRKEAGDRDRKAKEQQEREEKRTQGNVFEGPVPQPSILRLGENVPGQQPVSRGDDRENDSDMLRASTEKLSAVFDWIVDQAPSTDKLPLPSIPLLGSRKSDEEKKAEMKEREREKRESKREGAAKRARKSDLEDEKDLERFYVALARKLYDEGL